MGIPKEAQPTVITFEDINSWIERGSFYVAGIGASAAGGPEFERVWLELEVLDAAGKALEFEGRSSLSVSLFSEALPPQGRSAFFAAWSTKDFSGLPASFRVKSAWSVKVPAGPILVASEPEKTKMLFKPQRETEPGDDAWQLAGKILNPSDRNAAAVFEVLLYGADNRLWSAHRYNTADGIQSLSQAKEGPLEPGEKRRVSRLVKREDLPEGLQPSGIDHVMVLTSEDR